VPRLPATGVLATTTNSSGAVVAWTQRITARAGQYRLCWCAGGFSCSATEDFKIDLGGLLVVALFDSQDRTCVAGQSCSFDGLRGVALDSGDAVHVLDTCGASAELNGMPNGGRLTTTQSGAAYSFGSTKLTAAGGVYRLCWCASVDEGGCTEPTSFSLDAGTLTVIGPALTGLADATNFYNRSEIGNSTLRPRPGIERTCVAGQTCRVQHVYGQHLSAADEWRGLPVVLVR
jgi:hypothetical protein